MNDERAKKIKIMELLAGYSYLSGRSLDALIDQMVHVVDDCPVEAVALACDRFARGKVEGHTPGYAPGADQLAIQAGLFRDALAQIERNKAPTPKLISVPIGQPLPDGVVREIGIEDVDFGHGKINMRGMSTAEKEAIMANKGLPEPEPVKFKANNESVRALVQSTVKAVTK